MLYNMKDLLSVAVKYNFAVPAFNVSDYYMMKELVELAEDQKAPLILEIHPDELRHTGPEFVTAIREKVSKIKIPVCIHLDHGADFTQVMTAIRAGFTSVMIDGSSLPFEENIAICKKVAEAAHAVNVSVEGELGTIGTTNDKQAEAGADAIIYTDPDDVKQFLERSGVDTLAVAIGTCHGLYPKGFIPKLRLDILEEIRSRVNVPLVLHGGSNNPDEEIREAVVKGINKINISSDIKTAYFMKMRKVLQDETLREPFAIQPDCGEAMKEVAAHKMELLQTTGKAVLY